LSEREVVLHPGAAAILPVLPDGRILLVQQDRPAVGERLWEIPAGKLEPGESPDNCARRELREETGHDADDWRKLCAIYTTPGFSDEHITIYLARHLRPVSQRDTAEIAAVAAVAPEEIEQRIAAGAIVDAKTIVAALWYLRRFG